MSFRSLTIAAVAAMACAPAVAFAADPAADKIEAFDSALIRTMKAGKDAGSQGRYKLMTPAVDSAFDLPAMVGFAVGPSWAATSAEDKAAVVAAFRRYTVANYAKNFDSYDGQKISVVGDVLTRGPDKVVKTEMTGGERVTLSYRMRMSGGSWKIIDVFFNGSISQLTTQRSDFSATVASGGAKALVAKLNAQADKLLK